MLFVPIHGNTCTYLYMGIYIIYNVYDVRDIYIYILHATFISIVECLYRYLHISLYVNTESSINSVQTLNA